MPGREVPAKFEWPWFLLALFLPILIGWAVAYAAVFAVRWVVAGFRPSP